MIIQGDDSVKLGFIGGGALAGALVKSLAGKLIGNPADIYVSDHKQERCDELRKEYRVNATVGADSFAGEVDVLVLAIKPKDARKAMEEVASKVRRDALIVSVVAGMKLVDIEPYFPQNPVIRVMPNVPQSVGEGMAAYALGPRVSKEDAAKAHDIWASVGKVVEVPENLMDAVTGLSGSGPAFAFLMIDALADGGVAAGLPRKTAILLAAQTLLGSAKMVLETGLHPDVLRDQVTSPAGTTIAGVRALEEKGLRSALIEAVIAATERSRELGK